MMRVGFGQCSEVFAFKHFEAVPFAIWRCPVFLSWKDHEGCSSWCLAGSGGMGCRESCWRLFRGGPFCNSLLVWERVPEVTTFGQQC